MSDEISVERLILYEKMAQRSSGDLFYHIFEWRLMEGLSMQLPVGMMRREEDNADGQLELQGFYEGQLVFNHVGFL